MTGSSATLVAHLRKRPRARTLALFLLVAALVAALVAGVLASVGASGGASGGSGTATRHGAPTASGPARTEPAPAPADRPTASARGSVPAPERAPVVAPMPRSVPERLRIPAIGVDSRLIDLGLQPDGSLETPPGAFPAGWFSGSPTPGETGPAIVVGHVRYVTPGVFARLDELGRGARIEIVRRDGSTARFEVTRSVRVDKDAFPTQQVYGDIDRPGLRLITCGGLDPRSNEYDENVVVFADLAPA